MARTLKYFPLTFVAGAWGFVFFLPYLFVFIAAIGLTGRYRRAKLAAA